MSHSTHTMPLNRRRVGGAVHGTRGEVGLLDGAHVGVVVLVRIGRAGESELGLLVAERRAESKMWCDDGPEPSGELHREARWPTWRSRKPTVDWAAACFRAPRRPS
ncbi:MAG: hypothetical protein U0W40_17975 [Acidimicrobiia bacterium]